MRRASLRSNTAWGLAWQRAHQQAKLNHHTGQPYSPKLGNAYPTSHRQRDIALPAVLPGVIGGRPFRSDLQQPRCNGTFVTAKFLRQLGQRGTLSAALGEPLLVFGAPGLVRIGVQSPLLLHGVRLGLFWFSRGAWFGHEVAGVGREFEAVQLPADGFFAAPEFLCQLLRALACSVVLFEVGEGLGCPCLAVAGGFDGDGRSGSRGGLHSGGDGNRGDRSRGDKTADLVEVARVHLSSEFAVDDSVRSADDDSDFDTALRQKVSVQAVAAVRTADLKPHCRCIPRCSRGREHAMVPWRQ
ncbi:hypothetical protein VR41_10325 [Streptomyces sp. NRRL B-1568]|nr:hypothetical protein VR41_10325 [Streptomyces sp. NRRL B-1568]